ncbi:MAG: STAS domain-containing protein [Gammaproteobacteria bacterium]|nr:STAS domain-containing protein [Gammaproteobacteria bacterium]
MDSDKIDLGTRCTIVKAEELHAQMENLIQSGNDVEIHASNIEQIDTSALQLLLSFHQALQADNRKLSWPNPSEHLVATAKLLGIDRQIGISGQ